MQNLFPISYSTLSPDALAAFISQQYDLPAASCRFLVRGVGDTYLIETGKSTFIFRVYRSSHRGHGAIEGETTLLKALHAAGVSVSYPVADKNGSLIQSFTAAEGNRYGALFSFAAGKVIPAPNDAQLRSLGHEIAKFHNVSSSITLTGVTRKFDLQTTLFDPLDRTRSYFLNDQEGYEWLNNMAGRIKAALDKLDTSAFSSGYCHFDFLPKNFHFDGDKVTLFDFDFLGYGWLVNDLMIFWTHLQMDQQFNRITKERAEDSFRILIGAYREIRPVTDDELKAIPYLALGFWLFYMEFHSTHDQFYQLIAEPAMLKMRIAFVRQLIERNWPEE
ncbi:phosphotransferase [Terrimonas sp. NA20]|uniref:Phosphotransferase n=1 Tax=Terrimonas ginsenosidimutans TaxID=2908004 RepID=A0ABS9KWA4_9BACT|nr:phosphotransferase [Terrimonas ginsenosidimutans]MCG2616585.1 phosphotransferase [Terrimonas ginsenosidimutans]